MCLLYTLDIMCCHNRLDNNMGVPKLPAALVLAFPMAGNRVKQDDSISKGIRNSASNKSLGALLGLEGPSASETECFFSFLF